MWDKIVKNLSNQLSRPQYESWIKPIKYLNADDCYIYLAVPSDYNKNWIIKNLSEQIIETINTETGQNLTLKIEVDPALVAQIDTQEENDSSHIKNKLSGKQKERIKSREPLLNENLNKKYTFDTFVVGPTNTFAYTMAQVIADSPGKAHNPLFIYGGVGLGKTHLMHAIGHHMYAKNPQKKIKYATTENFTNELIESIRYKRSSEFRNRYRQTDLLLLDDVQFLDGKEMTQEELFNTFNNLHEAGKQIVLSSDRPPKKIPNLTERLISRFEWGVTVDLQSPDIETRIAILKNKATSDGMNIPGDVIELIASAYQNNIRELEGALNRVIAYVSVTGSPMTVSSIRGLIDATSNKRNLTPDRIIEVVAEEFKLSAADLKANSRMKAVSQARQIAIFLIREITSQSFPAIGEVFAKKHSTIIYAYEKVNEEIMKDHSFSKYIAELRARITS